MNQIVFTTVYVSKSCSTPQDSDVKGNISPKLILQVVVDILDRLFLKLVLLPQFSVPHLPHYFCPLNFFCSFILSVSQYSVLQEFSQNNLTEALTHNYYLWEDSSTNLVSSSYTTSWYEFAHYCPNELSFLTLTHFRYKYRTFKVSHMASDFGCYFFYSHLFCMR